MNNKSMALTSVFISLLADEDKPVYGQLADFLSEQGYIPQRQKVKGYVLSFKHHENRKVIAKLGITGSQDSPYFKMKFFACRDVRQKYTEALRREIESHNGQYCGPIRHPQEKNRCGSCKECTGGGLGYYYAYPDGREVLRCGAYPILIPDITPADMPEIKAMLMQQHNYFLSIT